LPIETRIEIDKLMQPLVQGTLEEWTDVPMLHLLAHLPQTHSQSTPTLDLGIYFIADALIGRQQAAEVDLHTATA